VTSAPKIAIDAMGGDTGPAVMIAGAERAWRRRDDLGFLLFGDEAMGVQILWRSLAAPMAAIAENAGLDASSIVYNAEQYNLDLTFDVLRQEWVDPWEEAILDPLAVAQEALRSGASAAMMAITTDVLIRKKKVNWEEEEVIPRRPQRRGERA
jgi:chaperonin GroEL (HSP60 family)